MYDNHSIIIMVENYWLLLLPSFMSTEKKNQKTAPQNFRRSQRGELNPKQKIKTEKDENNC